METVFGYKPDPQYRVKNGVSVDLLAKDRRFSSKLFVSTGAEDIDLSPFCVAMNQYNLSACAGNAVAESVEVLNNIAGYTPTPLSRLFIYSLARNEEEDPENPGQTMLGKDTGSSIRDCFDVLSRFGVCDEYIWPYDGEKVFTSPSLMAQRQALGHKIHSYYRIDSTGSDRVDDVISALRSKHPVVFGTSIESSFMQISSNTPVGPPQGVTVGSHAMCIVGYVGGNFVVKNSWGTNWGFGGFWMMTPEYVMSDLTGDLWVPTLGMSFAT